MCKYWFMVFGSYIKVIIHQIKKQHDDANLFSSLQLDALDWHMPSGSRWEVIFCCCLYLCNEACFRLILDYCQNFVKFQALRASGQRSTTRTESDWDTFKWTQKEGWSLTGSTSPDACGSYIKGKSHFKEPVWVKSTWPVRWNSYKPQVISKRSQTAARRINQEYVRNKTRHGKIYIKCSSNVDDHIFPDLLLLLVLFIHEGHLWIISKLFKLSTYRDRIMSHDDDPVLTQY